MRPSVRPWNFQRSYSPKTLGKEKKYEKWEPLSRPIKTGHMATGICQTSNFYILFAVLLIACIANRAQL